MLKSILDALSAGISAVVPNVPIYAGDITGDVPERYFSIGFAGDITTTPIPFKGYALSGTLDITYLAPQHIDAMQRRQELYGVYFALSVGLTEVTHGDLLLRLKSHRCSNDLTEGVMHDLCGFELTLLPIDNTAKIGSVDIDKEEFK